MSFELHVILQSARAERGAPSNPDLIYHTDVNSGHLTTRSVKSGQSYVVIATVYNIIGSSEKSTYGEFGHIY